MRPSVVVAIMRDTLSRALARPSARLLGDMWARGRSLCRGSEDPCVRTDARSSVSIHRTPPLAAPLPGLDSPRIVLRLAPRRRSNRPRLRRRSAARAGTQKQKQQTPNVYYYLYNYTPRSPAGHARLRARAHSGFAAVMSDPSLPRIVFA
ncbi:hypothetical protein VTO73DRAFT_416 [Trametes versicolor]